MNSRTAEASVRPKDRTQPGLRYPLHHVGSVPVASEGQRQEVRRRLFGLATAHAIEAKLKTDLDGISASEPSASEAAPPPAANCLEFLDGYRRLSWHAGKRLKPFGFKAKRWRDARRYRPTVRGTDDERCGRHLAISEWYSRELVAEEAEAERLVELEEAVDAAVAAETKLREDEWFAGRLEQIARDEAREAEVDRARRERDAALEAKLEADRIEAARAKAMKAEAAESRSKAKAEAALTRAEAKAEAALNRAEAKAAAKREARLRREAREASARRIEEARARAELAGPLLVDLLAWATKCAAASIAPVDAVTAWRTQIEQSYSREWGPNAVVWRNPDETCRRRARAFAEAHFLLEIGRLVPAGATASVEERRWLRKLSSGRRSELAADWIGMRTAAILASGAPSWSIGKVADRVYRGSLAKISAKQSERRTSTTRGRTSSTRKRTSPTRKAVDVPKEQVANESREQDALPVHFPIAAAKSVASVRRHVLSASPDFPSFMDQARSALPRQAIRWRRGQQDMPFGELVASVMYGGVAGCRLVLFHKSHPGAAIFDVRCPRQQLVDRWSRCVAAAVDPIRAQNRLPSAKQMDAVSHLRLDLTVGEAIEVLRRIGLRLAVGVINDDKFVS